MLPAINNIKLVIIVLLFMNIFTRLPNEDCDKVPYLVVTVASIIYTSFALLITMKKKEDTVAKLSLLKKVFKGRTIHWHEIVSFKKANFYYFHYFSILQQTYLWLLVTWVFYFSFSWITIMISLIGWVKVNFRTKFYIQWPYTFFK